MNNIYQKIIDLISEKKINLKSAVDIVKIAMQEVEKMNELTGINKQKMVLEIVSEIAKGKDGISGTQDDIIPINVMNGVKSLLEHDLIPSIINVIIDATNGRLDVNKVNNCFTSIIQTIFTCTQGKGDGKDQVDS